MRKPLSLWVIVGASILQVSVLCLVVVVILSAAVVPPAGTEPGFRAGLVRGLGYDPAELGAEQAGMVLGYHLVPILLASLIIAFVLSRKLLAVRITAALELLRALGAGGVPILGALVLLVSFAPSLKRYCTETGGSAEEVGNVYPQESGPSSSRT